MPIIIPYRREGTESNTNKKSKKLYIYFKKEIDLDEDFKEFVKITKKAYDLGLFDEIFISKHELYEVEKFREAYSLAVLNEVKFVKKEVDVLKNVVHSLIEIVKHLRKHLYEEYKSIKEVE